MYKKISDYGVIGNLHSVALIGLDGSIDWLCMPHIDSPSVFGALLDDKKGGRFSITPYGEYDSTAEYIPGTNVLITKFRTRTGSMRVIDFMPVDLSQREERHELYRCVNILSGSLTVAVHFEPRFNYARTETLLERVPGGVLAKGDGEDMVLSCSRDLVIEDTIAQAMWDMAEGDSIWMQVAYGTEHPIGLASGRAEEVLQATVSYWKDWLETSETGRTIDLGPYRAMVERSALILKLLYYHPAGTITAAATTSLPEVIGGIRNWDYRYTWVRDTAFTLQALFNLGHLSEMEGYFRWIKRLLSEHGAANLQIMYGLHGEPVRPEVELAHLDGYKGSKPVRIGNAAAGQMQLDIYGEIMDAALRLSDYVGKVDYELWPLLCNVCDNAAEHWKERDSGIWEVRGGPYHFVYSKVMCWLALDRGLTIAHRYGFPVDREKWEQAREKIREEILISGWSRQKRAFVQHYETDSLDASNLLIPVLGFLPFDDPRVISTVEATIRELSRDDLLYRYKADNHLPGEEGNFLLCTFWLIDNLIGQRRFEEAERLLHKMEGIANHLGIFSEEYNLQWRESLGNVPQAFTHIGYINSVIALLQAKEALAADQKRKALRKKLPVLGTVLLNDGAPREYIPPQGLAQRLKTCMNTLRGAYFDTTSGRVAYERVAMSKIYQEYVELSYALKSMDPGGLGSREERIAFWVNLYNVIVIHGVIELGIRDSVKEVRDFFKRIQYQIDDMFFSPDDIEHGILRGNRRPPRKLRKTFSRNDKRLRLSIEPIDPRIHFALVCASSSCPPIDVYTPEGLDYELTIAGRTFLNAGGITIDKKKGQAALSRIFKWYAEDFGADTAERLRFIAPFLYKEEDRRFLEEKAGQLKITYQHYDWRLNRY
ncbi:MAG: glycoside hydrolase family 15 protein [Nitrospirota bacterium]